MYRYVYHPLDEVYIVLVTTKSSNIVEDLDTIRLLSKRTFAAASLLPLAQLASCPTPPYLVSAVVPEQLGGRSATEEAIVEHAFDLIFALDEAITADGHKEGGGLDSIRENLAMDSHEEKLASLIKKSREAEAAQTATRKAEELRASRAEEARTRAALGGSGAGPAPARAAGRYGGVGSSSYTAGGGGGGGSAGLNAASHSSSGYGGYSGGSQSASAGSATAAAPASAPAPAPASRGRGMKLGGGSASGGGGLGGGAKGTGSLAAMMAEEGMDSGYLAKLQGGADGGAAANDGAEAVVSKAAAAAAAASADEASVAVDERITAVLTRDGEASVQVKGSLTLSVHNPSATRIRVNLSKGSDTDSWSFQNHPNTDKALFASSNCIALKDASKTFPVGNPVGVLRWRKASKDADFAPLALNVWPEDSGNGSVALNVEYTLQQEHMELKNVVVCIPLPTGAAEADVQVGSVDGEVAVHDGQLVWNIGSISSANGSGILEVTVRGDDEDAFFPVGVEFNSSTCVLPMAVTGVTLEDDEQKPVRHSVQCSVRPASYQVQGFA